MGIQLYELDFYAWTRQQAALLRAGRLSEADIEHIADEIESMGKAERRELTYRLMVLLTHRLKWHYQPGERSAAWEVGIRDQQLAIANHLTINPGLKKKLPLAVAVAYNYARGEAAVEANLPYVTFPPLCPWPFSKIMSADF